MQRLYTKPLVNNLTVNISIVGMNGSGKSAILVKYLTRRFIVEYAPYLSDSYTKADTIDGQDVTLNIQDTSDSDDIDLEDILNWSQAIIVLFSITSRRSFYRAQELLESIKQSIEPQSSLARPTTQRPSSTGSSSLLNASQTGSNVNTPPMGPGYVGSLRRTAVYGVSTAKTPTLILVATKSDLDRFRLVEKSEAEALAKTHNIAYYETTAAETYQQIQCIFHAVVRLSNSTRFAKIRGPNGATTNVGRSLSSNAGNLNAATGSVLSSLAVSPGLLLQKKGLPLPGLPPTIPDPPALSSTEGENTLANQMVRLTNLRFRGASPPAFGKNLRSPSPNVGLGSRNQASPLVSTADASTTTTSGAGRNTLSHTQSFTSSPGTTTDQTAKPITTSHPQKTPQHQPQTKETKDESSTAKTTHPTPSANVQTAQAPPPLPPKRGPIGFRLFGRKAK